MKNSIPVFYMNWVKTLNERKLSVEKQNLLEAREVLRKEPSQNLIRSKIKIIEKLENERHRHLNL